MTAQAAIFGPVLAMMLLTGAVWLYMHLRRVAFLARLPLGSANLAVPGALARMTPPNVSNPADNLKNLFEIPILFYALALYLFVTNQVDTLYLLLAWIFVLMRWAHSAIHCTINNVAMRFYLEAFSTLTLWLMLLRAALHYLFA